MPDAFPPFQFNNPPPAGSAFAYAGNGNFVWMAPGGVPTGTVTAALSAYTTQFGEFIIVDPSSGAVTINLPAIAAGNAGGKISIKNIKNSNTPITLIPAAASQTIDGAAQYVMDVPLMGIEIFSDGISNWMVMG